MINKNVIVVEFSVKQDAFHKHTLHRMVLSNIKNILRGKETDYLPIGVFETHEEADKYINEIYDKFKRNILL
jgi:hypothetical protein